MPTLDCLHRHIFLFHIYRSVSLARMRRYMQLAYLFHQCVKRFLSGDSRIADCTMRHPGVERPFSSWSFSETNIGVIFIWWPHTRIQWSMKIIFQRVRVLVAYKYPYLISCTIFDMYFKTFVGVWGKCIRNWLNFSVFKLRFISIWRWPIKNY